jgi:hypothetical protein
MSLINGYVLPGIVGYQYVTSSITTTGGLMTKLYSIKIPANTVKVGDVITIESLITRGDNSGNIQHSIYWNNSDDITTSPVLIADVAGSTSDNYRPLVRSFAVVSSTSTVHMNPSIMNRITDFGSTDDQELTQSGGINPFTTSSLDWTVDSWILLASSNTNPVGWYLKVTK